MRVELFTDGSGTHQKSGPAFVGVVLFVDGEPVLTSSDHVGFGTAQYAELRAIRRGLHLLGCHLGMAAVEQGCTLWTDSEYSAGVLAPNCDWKIRAHAELIEAVRAQLSELPRVKVAHVKGHTGVYGNEVADWLAHLARVKWQRIHDPTRAKALRRPPELLGPFPAVFDVPALRPPKKRKAKEVTDPELDAPDGEVIEDEAGKWRRCGDKWVPYVEG